MHWMKIMVLVVPMAGFLPSYESARPGARDNLTLAAVAGDYRYGDGLGVDCSLTVKPEGRFSFVWRGCLGVYGRLYDRTSAAARRAEC